MSIDPRVMNKSAPLVHIIDFKKKSFMLHMMLSYIKTGRIDLGGVRIYKRKQESKKRRKHALDQETDQVFFFFLGRERVFFLFFLERYRLFYFFLIAFLVEGVFSFFLFLGPKRVFSFSYFLVFFHKFPPLNVLNFKKNG